MPNKAAEKSQCASFFWDFENEAADFGKRSRCTGFEIKAAVKGSPQFAWTRGVAGDQSQFVHLNGHAHMKALKLVAIVMILQHSDTYTDHTLL